jgi:hypothetical protein
MIQVAVATPPCPRCGRPSQVWLPEVVYDALANRPRPATYDALIHAPLLDTRVRDLLPSWPPAARALLITGRHPVCPPPD